MTLRTIENKDLSLILNWRNHPEVRKNMINQHIITQEEHYQWYLNIKNDPTRQWLIYEFELGNPVGVIYFTDIKNEAASWGFYMSANAPKGMGTIMLNEALNYYFITKKMKKLHSEVLKANSKSIHLHHKFGFKNAQNLRNTDIELFQLSKFFLFNNDWSHIKEKLEEEVKIKKTLILSQLV